MAELEPQFEREQEAEQQTVEELAKMIETGKGKFVVTSERLLELAEDEATPKEFGIILRSAAEQIEKREKWGIDNLTGLMTASKLRDSLKDSFERAKEEGSKLTIVFYDLDNLKEANGAGEGYKGGDKLIKAMASALKDVYNPDNEKERPVGRWLVGDEFCAGVEHDRKIAERLDAALQEKIKETKITIGKEEISLSASAIIFELDPQKDLETQIDEASAKLVNFKKERKKGQEEAGDQAAG